jgi:hypothetical protein
MNGAGRNTKVGRELFTAEDRFAIARGPGAGPEPKQRIVAKRRTKRAEI